MVLICLGELLPVLHVVLYVVGTAAASLGGTAPLSEGCNMALVDVRLPVDLGRRGLCARLARLPVACASLVCAT